MKKILEENEKAVRTTKTIVLSVIGLFLLAYFGMAVFYATHFSCNLYANNLHLTGMEVKEANDYLLEHEDNSYTLVIAENGNQIATLSDQDIQSEYDYTSELQKMKSEESALVWFPYLTYERRYSVKPELKYDRDTAMKSILSLEPVESLSDRHDSFVQIAKTNTDGYRLVSPKDNQPDKQKLANLILSKVEDGVTYMDLANADYSVETEYSKDQQETIELFEKINDYQNTDIIFEDHGRRMPLDRKTIAGFLKKDVSGNFVTDADGRPMFDDEKIEECAKEVAEAFTTEGSKIYWNKYKGGTVSINAGCFGKTVDTEALTERIRDLLVNGKDYCGPPDYLAKENADPDAPEEIGDTWIEVDMTAQKLYYIKDGRLFLTSDVVTGCKGRGNDTPRSMEYIYFMQKNRVLVGPDYRTPVKFWMAFNNHVGLHDADWRSAFGGEIYKSSGSHGCVNLPPDFAAKLYENAYVGLPVITYY